MFNLAQTAWPRFGGDQANRSRTNIRGPHTTPTWQKITLSTHYPSRPLDRSAVSGVIVMPDETLRVCHAGMLSAVTFDGTILWQLDLSSLIPEDDHYYYSLPTALQTGETILALPDALLIVDRLGNNYRRENQIAPDDVRGSQKTIYGIDDSGFSPNLTYSGLPILTAVPGEVYVLKKDLWHEIGIYGYDIVPPAVYPDNSLAIAGYAGTGFCRVNLDGKKQWTTHVKMADQLPTLNHEYIAAVGVGVSGGYSAFFQSDGEQIGEYKHSAKFAEYIDGGWIALSKQHLARLTTDGKEVWGCEIHSGAHYSFAEQPIVDMDGFIFVRQEEGYLCCDAHGHKVFEVIPPTSPQGLMSIIAPDTMAYVIENELFIGHS
jgi:hypothetical protein